MRVTLDCLLGKDVDQTWTFLSAFAAELTIFGHHVFDGSEEDRFSGMQNVNQLHEYASNSNLPINADKVRELRQIMQDWGLERDFADVEQVIRSKMSQLLINKETHVITWGSTHYHSNLMRIASSQLGLDCLNIERGLIPNS